ncbi:MAG: hypothetical protein BWY80_00709 [Firmicutes bacterium ADurb.Bin456]|nr:MAG: hypothetical protein BWY80_00709 [Firmicutes bacterium ADurb.Bin456]
MIKIEISEDARDFIRKKADAVTVEAMEMSGCFGAFIMPVAIEGEPAEPENYDEVMADGIKVYLSKGAVCEPEGPRIYLKGDKFIYQTLEVEGLRYEI